MAVNSTNKERVFQLRCAHQTFTWGKLGQSSLVAQLLKNSDGTTEIEPETPYAEMWMGTHCLGTSRIVRPDGTEEPLDKWIERTPHVINLREDTRHYNSLPFMFKVLSIRKTLSLQVHPDKMTAKTLHERFPDIYKDGNHKPEMAIAINDFRALVGFKPIGAFARHLEDIEELRHIVGTDNANQLVNVAKTADKTKQREALRLCFEEAFLIDLHSKLEHLDRLIKRVRDLYESGEDDTMFEGADLLKIAEEYPDDMGALAVYFLNEVTLKPGEALFINVNEPHAYLEGDCLECLSCSHNIVRFGLTHKIKDVDSLVQMLKYNSIQHEDILVKQVSYEENGCCMTQYLPPVEEFAVTRIEIPHNTSTTTEINPIETASILLCIEGEGSISNGTNEHYIRVVTGTAVFASARETLHVDKDSSHLVLYRAYIPFNT